jgi:peptidoglycan/xylan/chitin deacetylase (PgdA/CDA1 family)
MAEATKFSWPKGYRAALSFTFDDARSSQVDVGLPILDAHDVKGTFYVCPDPVMQRLDGWKGAVANGHEIGNHTHSHPCGCNFEFSRKNALEDYNLEGMAEELEEASAFVQDTLAVSPTTFAYPCGQTYVGRGAATASYVPLVAERFDMGRIWPNEYHNCPGVCDLAQANGTPLDGKTFNEAMAYINAALEDGGWLIFGGHEVMAEGRQNILPETLDAVCLWLRATENGIWVDTAANIAAYIKAQRSA